jgi:hypothetical protein
MWRSATELESGRRKGRGGARGVPQHGAPALKDDNGSVTVL